MPTVTKSNRLRPGAPDRVTGFLQLAELCEKLISEGVNYLDTDIGRSPHDGWTVCVKDRSLGMKGILVMGHGSNMNEACGICVKNYYEIQRIEARKTELIQDPKVQEAIILFGLKDKNSQHIK